jgi:hypothetical protein
MRHFRGNVKKRLEIGAGSGLRVAADALLTVDRRGYTVRDPMALEKEIATYQAKLAQLKEHEGKFVLIHEDVVVDFFSTYEDAIKAGYQQFQLQPFLVKRVLTTEPVLYITRNILPTVVVLSR